MTKFMPLEERALLFYLPSNSSRPVQRRICCLRIESEWDRLKSSPMQIPLVMTVIGKDRTGLVESVARLVADHGGNWLESRMCRLGGEFAGILRVHVPSDRRTALEQALSKLPGLAVVVHSDEAVDIAPKPQLAALEVIAQDRLGIVREVSHA